MHTNDRYQSQMNFQRYNKHDFNKPKRTNVVELIKKEGKAHLKLFLGTSSIHGLSHLVARRRHCCEIFFWLIIIVLSASGSLYLSSITWNRYQSSSTVISMDKDMFAWNTTFPSVTICPDRISNIDTNKLEAFFNETKGNPRRRLIKSFILSLANASYDSFENVPMYVDDIEPDKYMELLINLSLPFNPSMTFDNKLLEKPIIRTTVTEMGICYSFNSRTAIYNSPEYLAAKRWDIVANENETSYIHPLDGEVFVKISINRHNAFTVYVHGPQETPDIASKFNLLEANRFLKVYVSAFTVYTSPEAAKLSVSQRRCRFHYENDLKHNAIYTYNMCRMECRIRLCLNFCKCIPHFYRRISDEKVCDVTGLHCLASYKEELYRLIDRKGRRILCGCLPLCDDVNYVLIPDALTNSVLGATDLQWGMVTYPRMRYKRDIIFSFTDVLVSVGGMAGLFLGCCVLSFMEIVYFLTLRLLCYYSGYRSTE